MRHGGWREEASKCYIGGKPLRCLPVLRASPGVQLGAFF